MADHNLEQLDNSAQAIHQIPGANVEIVEVDAIRGILVHFLKELGVPFSKPQYDHQFAQAARNEALRLGLFSPTHFDSTPNLQRAFELGAAMSISLYSHLSISRQYYICIYTALLVHLDDLAMMDATIVEEFNTTFLLQNGKHTHPILDGLAILLRTTQDHFGKNNTSMIITNTLDFISSLIMEEDQQSMTVHSAATNYPGYLRSLTGIGRAFALFFFPLDIPPQTYVQIVPDMINYLANVNDIFSFYKEELAGEMGNHISLIARVRGCTKLEALEHLVQVSIDDARRMEAVLESYPELCALVRKNMVEGCVRFHTFPRERYRLDDLHLDDDKC